MSKNRYPLHPACLVLPALSKDELADLAEGIKENGLRNPIVLHDGMILDGRNRLSACKLARVKPTFAEFGGDDPIGWVISQNLVRRHLTPSQRAVVAFDLLPLLEKEAKERQRLSKGRGKKVASRDATLNGKASTVAARIARSSAKSVERVKRVAKTSPKLVEEIREGRLTVAVAERLANNKRTKPKASVKKDERITKGECQKLIPTLEDGSVNLVVTSPPYAEQRKGHYSGIPEADYPDWCVEWMGLIWDKLADDGSVLMVIRPHVDRGAISDYVLKTRLALRDDGWNEADELVWLKPDAPPLGHNGRPRRTWESILWFSKLKNPYCNPKGIGKDSERIGFCGAFRSGTAIINEWQSLEMKNGLARCPDVFVAKMEKESVDHTAVYPVELCEQLILTFSREGDLVLDPFCGSGSTLIAAAKTGREGMGFEKEAKHVKEALPRLKLSDRNRRLNSRFVCPA